MINVNDIKNGITFVLDGEIYQVLEFSHVKPGKGAAFVKMKIRKSNDRKKSNAIFIFIR